HGFPRASDPAGKPRKRIPRMMLRALWFDQPAILPAAWSAAASEEAGVPQGLSCAGCGSVVMGPAALGLAGADAAGRRLLPALRRLRLGGDGHRGHGPGGGR